MKMGPSATDNVEVPSWGTYLVTALNNWRSVSDTHHLKSVPLLQASLHFAMATLTNNEVHVSYRCTSVAGFVRAAVNSWWLAHLDGYSR